MHARDATVGGAEKGEGVVLGLEGPEKVRREARGALEIASQVANEVEDVDSVVDEAAAAGDGQLVNPRMPELLSARVTRVGLDALDLADLARLDQPAREVDRLEAPVVEPAGETKSAALGLAAHLLRLLEMRREGLLAEHVLPRREGAMRHLGVGRRRRGDDDERDVVARDGGLPIGRGDRAQPLRHVVRGLGPEVGYGDQLQRVGLGHRLGAGGADVARPDERDADRGERRLRRRLLSRRPFRVSRRGLLPTRQTP